MPIRQLWRERHDEEWTTYESDADVDEDVDVDVDGDEGESERHAKRISHCKFMGQWRLAGSTQHTNMKGEPGRWEQYGLDEGSDLSTVGARIEEMWQEDEV